MKLIQSYPLTLTLLASCVPVLALAAVLSLFTDFGWRGVTAFVHGNQTQDTVSIGDILSVILSLPGITIPVIMTYVTYRNRDLQSEIVEILTKAIEKLGFNAGQMSPALAHAASKPVDQDRLASQASLKILDELTKLPNTYKAETDKYEPMTDETLGKFFAEFDTTKRHYRCYFEAKYDIEFLKKASYASLLFWIITFLWMAIKLIHGPMAGYFALEVGSSLFMATFNFLLYGFMWLANSHRSGVERSIRYNIARHAGIAAVVIKDHLDYLAEKDRSGTGLDPTKTATKPAGKR
jgi:ABC-type multidrug transport system fused ATPase/permease subunit